MKRSAWLFIPAFFLLALLAGRQLTIPYYPRYDSGAFLVAASSLAQGDGLREISHPDSPPFILYPPGYPVILASQILLFGRNLLLLRIHLLLLMAGILFLTWKIAPKPTNGWIVLFLSVSNLALWTTRIQGEIPLAFCLLLFLYVEKRKPPGWLTLLLISLLPLIKPIAVVFVLAFILDRLMKAIRTKRGWRDAGAAAMALLPFLLWAIACQPYLLKPSRTPILAETWSGQHTHQVSPLSTEFVERAGRNLWELAGQTIPYTLIFTDLHHRMGVSPPSLWPLGLLFLAGFFYLYRRKTLWGVIVTLHLLLLIAIPTLSLRYTVILLPLYLIGVADLLTAVSPRFIKRFRLDKIIPAAMVGTITMLTLLHPITHDLWSMTSVNGLTARVARQYLPPGAVVLVNDPYGFYWVTGHRAISYLASEQKSPGGYNLGDYVKRRAPLTHAAIYTWEYGKFKRRIARFHLKARPLCTRDDVIIMRLSYADR